MSDKTREALVRLLDALRDARSSKNGHIRTTHPLLLAEYDAKQLLRSTTHRADKPNGRGTDASQEPTQDQGTDQEPPEGTGNGTE